MAHFSKNQLLSKEKMQMTTDWQGRAKWLAQILILSVTFNVGLIFTLCYFALRDKKTFKSYELVPHEEHLSKASLTQTNEDVLAELSFLSLDQLIHLLNDKTLLEEGYTKRDLALTCLVAFHHFDLERALPHLDKQSKKATFIGEEGEKIDLTFYPHLSDESFEVLLNFAKREKFPITTEGLFHWLQATPTPKIKKTFARSFEFQAINNLFTHVGDLIDEDQLFDLILDCDWETLQKSIAIIQSSPQFTLDIRRDVLLTFLKSKSQIAAKMLLENDFNFAIKRLSNSEMDILLELAPEPYRENLITHVNQSLRGMTIDTPSKPEVRMHVIAEGDTLWDISRHYHIQLEALMKANDIQSEYRLRPGEKLLIPE